MQKRYSKTKKKFPPIPHMFFLFSISVLLGALLTPFLKSTNSSNTTPQKEAQKAYEICTENRTKKSQDKVQCYSQYFYSLTKRANAELAFDTVFELQKLDEYAKGCHLSAHGIGWAVYDKDPKNWKGSVEEVPKVCNFGAVHGIFERYLGSIGRGLLDKKTISNLCNEKQNTCIHIVGHILVVETDNNLNLSKSLCSVFPKNDEQLSDCLQGVYMEHMIGPNLFAHGMISQERRKNWAKHIDDFEELCRGATGEDARACWGVIVHAAYGKFDKNPQKMLAFCNTAQTKEAAAYCRRYTVGVTGTEWKDDLSKFIDICSLPQKDDPSFTKDCLSTFVKVSIANRPAEGSKEVVHFCSLLTGDDQKICFRTIKESISRFSLNSDYKETVCSSMPTHHISTCFSEK